MRLRRIRRMKRWYNCRSIGIVALCFIVGILYGARQRSEKRIKSTNEDENIDQRQSFQSWLKEEEGVKILGRKKLSFKTENAQPVFTRLPDVFAKNVYPPRTPAKRFPLEPHTVLDRIKDPDTGHSRYFMLFIVKTAPVHTNRREVIRRTWGSVKVVDGRMYNTIFVVGNVGLNSQLQKALEKEHEAYGDLLQTDAKEGYRNLPSKVLSAMQWLVLKSDVISSDLYTFTDDDCVMHIANIEDFFTSLTYSGSFNITKLNAATENRSRATSSDKQTDESKNPVNTSGTKEYETINESKSGDFESLPREKQNEKTAIEDQLLNDNFDGVMLKFAKLNAEQGIGIRETDEDSPRNTYPDLSERANNTQTQNSESVDYDEVNKNLTLYLVGALGSSATMYWEILHQRRMIPDAIYCGFSYDPHSKPSRNMKNKWGVTLEQYSEEVYPAFCHGGMYTMSGTLLSSLFAISTVTNYNDFHLEDVLVAGILREKSRVKDSKIVKRGGLKTQPLMYYGWDSGPRVMLKMTHKWRLYTIPLFRKKFVMEGFKDRKLIRKVHPPESNGSDS